MPRTSGRLVQGHAARALSAAARGASGKSELAALVADTLAKDADCRAHVVWVACGDARSEPLSQAQQQLAPLVRGERQAAAGSAGTPVQRDTWAW